MNAIRSTIKSLRDWIADIVSATKEAFAEMEAEKKNASPALSVLLSDYLNLRKAERSDWSRYGKQKGTSDDLNTFPLTQNVLGSIPATSADTFQAALLWAGQQQTALQAVSSIASPLPRQSSRALPGLDDWSKGLLRKLSSSLQGAFGRTQ